MDNQRVEEVLEQRALVRRQLDADQDAAVVDTLMAASKGLQLTWLFDPAVPDPVMHRVALRSCYEA